ncbi:xylose isomerase [Acetivibrio saccincola]|jgi:xylose isomerase|uniref:Xylose isomerase n=1 Tax=Acetivibrio saccincola TaxID=1677857 RepID=A0A2K9DY27_9FIRM|nr:xylose isomerase [Acetivibrio saccincola]AUG56437.1 Xylose isomerase [Acetivibrio saccincola]NLW27126.1 xylose isomerase [Acetivibrio saccincola]PQQ66524.1 xylose isomerase [Acetivibrio saccincola]HQD28283.1 xylose isomerase [Acetivibrio saccincola]
MAEFFKNISKIQYEGKDSDNPLAFKYYNPDEVIDGKTMKEHLRFAVAYWHTYQGVGVDPFGAGTAIRPWDDITDPMDLAKAKVEANFEFCEKLGVPYFCFHDRDIAPEASTLRETNKRLDEIVAKIKEYLKNSDVKLLWGTTNAFGHPRFVHGASTSPNADVFAFAAAQVKKAMEITLELGGENYVFWGGREGYETLLNTNMKLELDNMARFLQMAVDYAKEIGFKGQLLIEPKPKEPTKHQYDFDTATVYGFLLKYGLDKHFKMNIEANHATLAAHTFQHELRVARINGILGSIDANQGDLLLGWDTDQFPTNIYDTTLAMYEVIKAGGFTTGGLNFDAKVRRGSFEPEDLFYAHIAGMDAFAKGFKIANKIVKDGKFDKFIEERYKSYESGIGKDIVEGKVGFKELEEYALNNDQIKNVSGRQEVLEAILNQYILED